MHELTFLQDLAVVMSAAAIATLLFRQLKQPVVLGYIIAGVVIGPHTPSLLSLFDANGLVANRALIEDQSAIKTLAELGIIFLMFALGLEFSFSKLKKVGATAFIAASMEILVMVLAGYELGQAFGWNQMDSIFLGAILSISSTTIIIKALQELNKKREHFASLIIGILIVEDILAIVMIALLSGFATTGQFAIEDLGHTLVGLGAFLGILLVAGLILVPRLLNYVARFKSDEMLLVTTVGLCFAVSLVTVKLGYSVALGAFLIGAIIAEARQILKIEALMHPVRDLFSAVFFVSIGLLIDPKVIVQYWAPILAITAVVVVGKVFACSLGAFVSGNDMRTSLRVGMGLAQIGEFSFIIAALGLDKGVTSNFLYPIAVAVSALTTLLTPYLILVSDGVVNTFDRVAPPPLLRGMEAYSQWVGGLAQKSGGNIGRKFLFKLLGQIAINLLLVTGIFIGAIFLHRKMAAWWPEFPGGSEGRKAAAWLLAMLVSFPPLLAIWRKAEAGAMLIAEMRVTQTRAGAKTQGLRAIVSGTIFVVSTAALLLFVIGLSSTILPSRNLLILVIVVAIIFGLLLRRGAVKVYASAQAALQDTFAQPADPPEHSASLPALLREAKLEAVELRAGTAAVGKMILELKLRSQTGASIVGIDRQGASIVNPEPHEELAAGDQVLLIGRAEQLESAKKLLTS